MVLVNDVLDAMGLLGVGCIEVAVPKGILTRHAALIFSSGFVEHADVRAVCLTPVYRQCGSLTLATKDTLTIETVMSTRIATAIKIARKVLDPSNSLFFDVYKPLGRCVAVVNDQVDEHYGAEIDNYRAAHDVVC